MSDLHPPPGYEVESTLFGVRIVHGDRHVVVAVRGRSEEWIELKAWEDYAERVRDHIVERRVTALFLAGEVE